MATEQPIILSGAMLSPKAMAQPTMMMARLAVLATECVTPEIFLSARVETSLYR